MSQAAALAQLFTHAPFKQLTTATYSSVWLKSTTHGGDDIHARTVPQGDVRKVENASAPFDSLVNLVKGVLAGARTIDVSVGVQEFCITELPIVGGVEYATSTRGKVPLEARSEVQVSI